MVKEIRSVHFQDDVYKDEPICKDKHICKDEPIEPIHEHSAEEDESIHRDELKKEVIVRQADKIYLIHVKRIEKTPPTPSNHHQTHATTTHHPSFTLRLFAHPVTSALTIASILLLVAGILLLSLAMGCPQVFGVGLSLSAAATVLLAIKIISGFAISFGTMIQAGFLLFKNEKAGIQERKAEPSHPSFNDLNKLSGAFL